MVHSHIVTIPILSWFISIPPTPCLEWRHQDAVLSSVFSEKADTLFGELSCKIKPGKTKTRTKKPNQDSVKAKSRAREEKLGLQPEPLVQKKEGRAWEHWGRVRETATWMQAGSGQFYRLRRWRQECIYSIIHRVHTNGERRALPYIRTLTSEERIR